MAPSSNTLAETHPIPPLAVAPVPGTYCFRVASHSATAGSLGGVNRTPDAIQAPSSPSPGLAALNAVPLLMIAGPWEQQQEASAVAEAVLRPEVCDDGGVA